jgi:hypothetical protein
MKRSVYQLFSILLTGVFVVGSLTLFLCYKVDLPNIILIRWGAVVLTPLVLVILNLLMNLWMTSRGMFNRKLQGWIYPTVIYVFNAAIVYTAIEANDAHVTTEMLKMVIISIVVAVILSVVTFILGWIADKTYKTGWFVITSAVLGFLSVIAGALIFYQIINL